MKVFSDLRHLERMETVFEYFDQPISNSESVIHVGFGTKVGGGYYRLRLP